METRLAQNLGRAQRSDQRSTNRRTPRWSANALNGKPQNVCLEARDGEFCEVKPEPSGRGEKDESALVSASNRDQKVHYQSAWIHCQLDRENR